MKKNNKILKLVCFFLLIFTFSVNINAETVKIYYADEDGYKKTSETEPDGYPNAERSELIYKEKLKIGEHEAVEWYVCANDSGEYVYQKMSCMASNSDNPEFTHNSGSFYSCAQNANELIIEGTDKNSKKEKGDICTEYDEKWTVVESCDTTNSEICKTEGGENNGYWYKEVKNGTILDLSNNKNLYQALHLALTLDDIKNAEINFLDAEYKIAFADISKVTELYLTHYIVNDDNKNIYISDITELKSFIGLTKLDLSWNKITDISALSNLTNLIQLNLSSNDITNISALSNLTNLTQLILSSNDITDISALSNLTNLTELDLSYNKIIDISALSNLTNLTELDLRCNKIESIAPLINLINLEVLDLGLNKILDLNLISEFTDNFDYLFYNYNDFKKSDIIRNWNQFFNIINDKNVNRSVNLEDTSDSLIVNSERTYSDVNGNVINYSVKFNKNNNLLIYDSGDPVAFLEFLVLLLNIDYDTDDFDTYLDSDTLEFAVGDTEDGFTKDTVERFKSMLGKFGDYIIFDANYDDNDMVESFKFVLDMNYFYNYDKENNPFTGMANWLILLGIVLGCSAVGYVIINKHRRSIEL